MKSVFKYLTERSFKGSTLVDDKYFPNASRQGTVEYVEDRLKDGVNPNSLNDSVHPTTALHFACADANDLAKLKLLLQYGGDLEVLDSNDETPLLWGCYFTSVDCVKYLLEKGADVNAKGNEGNCMDVLGGYDHGTRKSREQTQKDMKTIEKLLLQHGFKTGFKK